MHGPLPDGKTSQILLQRQIVRTVPHRPLVCLLRIPSASARLFRHQFRYISAHAIHAACTFEFDSISSELVEYGSECDDIASVANLSNRDDGSLESGHLVRDLEVGRHFDAISRTETHRRDASSGEPLSSG